MRGRVDPQRPLLITVNLEEVIPSDHPIRGVKELADRVLERMKPELEQLYPPSGRRSVPPEVLLKSQLLMHLYSVRSERLFCERLRWDLLFQWFLDLAAVGEAFDATSFSKNRSRLLKLRTVRRFFGEVVLEAENLDLLSRQHFTVDGTLIEAAASMKSFRKKGQKGPGPGNPTGDFRGEKRTNATHESTTDPEAKLYRKGDGQPAQLAFLAHALMENRHGLCIDAELTQANGRAERQAAHAMVTRSTEPQKHRVTLGADKGYDTGEFQVALAEDGIVSHVAQKDGVTPLLDRRTTARSGYQTSQRRRKLVEQIFGWLKTVGMMSKARLRGLDRVATQLLLALTTYNLLRISRLQRAAA